MKKEKRIYNIMLEIFTWLWIITWFIAIWVEPYRTELLLTGLWSLILGIITSGAIKSSEKKSKEKVIIK